MQKVTTPRGHTVRFPITYSRLLARELRLDRAGQTRLLAGTRLRPDDLLALERLIGQDEQLTVIRNALAIADRPGLGLALGNRLPLAAHGPLGQLLAASPTLGDAWAALERFHALRVPLVTVRREVRAGEVWIHLRADVAPDDVRLFLVEVMVVTVQRSIELIIGRRLREARLLLVHTMPPHAADYATVLHSPYTFGGDCTAWCIPRQLMEEPNPFRDDTLYHAALRRCEQAASALAGDRARWRDRVTQLLQANPGALWTLAEVAAHFHVSPRTLIRQLKAEGCAWQQLLDAELARQSAELLLEKGHSVESAALAIGYRDATAFRRAFRRWTGMAPVAWRQEQGKKGSGLR
ncbi:MAG: AraC family transcriptional regulator ligand-binding domain-containing protein [Pseudomonadota bacterium]